MGRCLHGAKLLDISGPAEVFAEANRFGASYDITLVSPNGKPVATSVGIVLPVSGAASAAAPFDTVLVSGGDVFPDHARRATTHWRHARTLAARYPRIDVQPDSIFVKDRDMYTSAGVSAGIDLALALVEEDHGPALARDVARSLVVYMQRAGGQSQFSHALQVPVATTSLLRDLIDWIKSDLTRGYTVAAMAQHARLSPRHLNRLFIDEMQTTPSKFVQEIRFEEAKALLAAGRPVADTARRTGFGNRENLRRSFTQRLGVAPSAYQQRFSTTEPSPRPDRAAPSAP